MKTNTLNLNMTINQICDSLDLVANKKLIPSVLYFFLLQSKGYINSNILESIDSSENLFTSVTENVEEFSAEWKIFIKEKFNLYSIDLEILKEVYELNQAIIEEYKSADLKDMYNIYSYSILKIVPFSGLFNVDNFIIELLNHESITKINDLNLSKTSYFIKNREGTNSNYLDTLSFLNLFAYGILSKVSTVHAISLDNFVINGNQDYIVLNAATQKLDDPVMYNGMIIEDEFELFAQKALDHLNTNGKLVIANNDHMYNNTSKRISFIQKAIDEDLLEKIIRVDSNCIYNANEIFIFSKNKVNKNIVTFIDARRNKIKGDLPNVRHSTFMDVDTVEKINSNIEEEFFLQRVHTNTIKENNYNISYWNYLFIPYPSESLEVLAEYVNVLTEESENDKHSKLFINYYDFLLSTNQSNLINKARLVSDNFNISDCRVYHFTKPVSNIICINLDITHALLNPQPLYNINGKENSYQIDKNKEFNLIIDKKLNLLSIKEKANIKYLIEELKKPYVEHQIKHCVQSKEQRVLTMEDILNIKIAMPSISVQNSIINEFNLFEEKAENVNSLKKELIENHKKTETNDLASLNHTLGTPRARIMSIATNLENYISKNSSLFEKINENYKDYYERSIIDSVKIVKKDINYITDLINISINGLDLNQYTVESIALKDIIVYLESLIGKYSKFELLVSCDNNNTLNNSENYYVETNLTLLQIVMDNILNNAEKYAFDAFSTNNKVVIGLEISNNQLLNVSIKNNGKPFPKNLTKEKFITKYNTSDKERGLGIGGYDIDRILNWLITKPSEELDEYYSPLNLFIMDGVILPNAKKKHFLSENDELWKLILDEKNEFPVCFEFELPINELLD